MLSRRHTALALLTTLAVANAFAHGPTRQKVVEKIVIDAPPEAVWAQIKDFDALAKWHPAVEASPADKANSEGSVRSIKLKGGGGLVETLEKYNAEGKSYTYRIKDGGALPVSNYSATIGVSGDGAKSTVEWRGAFYRAYQNNNPPPDQNDEAAVKAVTGVYQSGLANLKKLVEKK